MAAIKILATALCLLASGSAFADDPLPRAKPEDVGLSTERLARISATLKADIEAGRIPGAVIAIARHGKLGQRFLGSNHIRQPRRVCRTMCG
jgi:hypothetical protein